MWGPVHRWIAENQEKQNARDWERGYDWAAGALLRGTDPQELELRLDASSFCTHFDKGANAALRTWEKYRKGKG